MIEVSNGPEKIVKLRFTGGVITSVTVRLADGSLQDFVPDVKQPKPHNQYVGKHERLIRGYQYGRTCTQPG